MCIGKRDRPTDDRFPMAAARSVASQPHFKSPGPDYLAGTQSIGSCVCPAFDPRATRVIRLHRHDDSQVDDDNGVRNMSTGSVRASSGARAGAGSGDGPTWFERYVVGPLKFVVFLLSLAVVARRDQAGGDACRRRRPPRRNKLRVRSRTPKAVETSDYESDVSERARGVLHSFQSRVAALEVSTTPGPALPWLLLTSHR